MLLALVGVRIFSEHSWRSYNHHMVVFWQFSGEFLVIRFDSVRPLPEGVLPFTQGTLS